METNWGSIHPQISIGGKEACVICVVVNSHPFFGVVLMIHVQKSSQ
jgi:hypothetical protein